ncbi:ComEC/Rec2 family competence protein [Phenylobacterium deserti]|nr:ComEC/Rec2 family competence protein [Phenylobacterium deserti]
MQLDRWTLWTPVAFGLGAALYFSLPREPLALVAWAGLTITAVLLALAAVSHPRGAKIVLVLAACAIGGFSAAKVRTERVAAPIAPPAAGAQRLEGWVVDVAAPGEGGQRLLIAPYRIGDWSPEATPARVRVTLRPGAYLPSPGAPVRLLALINPPPPPASPGSYDFARDAFFESVGGVGLALSPPVTWEPQAPAPWRLRLTMAVNAARWELSRRIVDTLGPETGGLAAAMTTGQEAFLPREQVEDLRTAGLAHIISISGLHMAIVGGFAFALARLLIAAWPWLALRVSGKKVAAIVGLAAVGGYLLLSGAPPPAVRAAVTASVAFCAILVDRQAISLHALALAAMAVLLIQPEAVTEPGFQMSFAATAALVALAEAWPRPAREINTPWPIRLVQAIGVWLAASLGASFVAGVATGPIAMHHFNRVATWGLISNLAAAPVSSFLMMPALALGAALTPVGLGELPLAAAGFAISLLNRIAQAAAAAPFAELVVSSGPGWTLPAAFLGILWLCLWRGRLRWLGLPLALSVSLAPRPPAPAAWVSADGAAVAVRTGGEALLLRPDVKLFGAELWARRHGLAVQDPARRDAAFNCDRWSCAPQAGAPVALAAAWNLKRPLADGRAQALCSSAEVLIWRGPTPPPNCGARLVLSAADFQRGGAAELYRSSDGTWRAVWAQDLRGRRPWTWGSDPQP